MISVDINKINSVRRGKGYPVFENSPKPFNINLTGIRSKSNVPGKFDDLMVLAWKHNGIWNVRTFNQTTDPGLYYLNNPLNPKGTAIMKEGFYPGLWRVGKHQGKYEALVQRGNVTVIRDFDRDNELDFNSGKEETADNLGINCHRANENGQSVDVGKWSAGCQVLQNNRMRHPEKKIDTYSFDYFMELCKSQIPYHGDSFSYALLNEKDFI